MTSKTNYTFSDEDIKLLKDVLINGMKKNPCLSCPPIDRQVCCGCEKDREYIKYIKIFSDKGIEKIAEELNEFRDEVNHLNNIRKSFIKLTKEVPEISDKLIDTYFEDYPEMQSLLKFSIQSEESMIDSIIRENIKK